MPAKKIANSSPPIRPIRSVRRTSARSSRADLDEDVIGDLVPHVAVDRAEADEIEREQDTTRVRGRDAYG